MGHAGSSGSFGWRWPVPFVRRDDEWDRWGDNWYLRGNFGTVTTDESDGADEDTEFDEGYLVALAFGRRVSHGEDPLNFDLELELVWNDQDADDDPPIQALSDLTVLGLLFNGVLDWRLGDRFSLYGGAGLGAAGLDAGTESDALNSFDEEDGPFLAWQAKAGLLWRFTPRTAGQLGYRFLNIDDAEIDDDIGNASFDLETQQHALEVGLRWDL